MSNKQVEQSIQLPEIINQLNRINGYVFNLKQGARLLIDGVERGSNLDELKTIIEITGIKKALEELETRA